MADNQPLLADPAGILSSTESPLAPPSTPAVNGTASESQPTNAATTGTPQEPVVTEVQMQDAPAEQQPLPSSTATPAPTGPATSTAPAAALNNNNAPSPLPVRTSTPMRNLPGETGAAGGSGSRAASAHPDPAATMPAEAALHGAPARQYLNSKVTPSLLEGMKKIALEQPKDPLRMLGEFLLQRSKELEEAK